MKKKNYFKAKFNQKLKENAYPDVFFSIFFNRMNLRVFHGLQGSGKIRFGISSQYKLKITLNLMIPKTEKEKVF